MRYCICRNQKQNWKGKTEYGNSDHNDSARAKTKISILVIQYESLKGYEILSEIILHIVSYSFDSLSNYIEVATATIAVLSFKN